jgi:branched-chain amino acid transport system permease protein
MVTLAFGTIIEILINEMTFLTNGPLGISLTKKVIFDWRPYADSLPFLKMALPRMREMQFYFVVAICFVLTLVVISRLVASRYGRAFEALRDSPIASDCMAVSVYKHKVLAFVVSAGFAGLAGVLFAYSEQYIAPNNFSFEQSITFLLAVTMGGRKSRVGPILGSAIVVYLPNLLSDIEQFRVVAAIIAVVAVVIGGIRLVRVSEDRLKTAIPVALCLAFFVFSLFLQKITDYKLTIYGMMILFVVYYLPDGIYGFLRTTVGKFRPDWVRLGGDGARHRTWHGAAGRAQRRHAVRRAAGARHGQHRRATAHRARADRAERFGQEHDDERADRHLHPHLRWCGVRRPRHRGQDIGGDRRGRDRAHVSERAAVRRADLP